MGDPSYFDASKTRVVGQVIRSICILDHPVANTNNAESAYIIIPAAQARHHDIYVSVVSHVHKVAAPGKYIAIVSTTVESNDPLREIEPGIQILGHILER